jgi:hypothetical protein
MHFAHTIVITVNYIKREFPWIIEKKLLKKNIELFVANKQKSIKI